MAERFKRALSPSGLIGARDEVANAVIQALAHSYGVILSNKATEIEGKSPSDLSSYECVALYHLYTSCHDLGLHMRARKCLERTIAREPNFSEAFACLSQVYSDAFRFRIGSAAESEQLRPKALHPAQRAIALAPRSSHAFHAIAVAYWFLNDIRSSLDAYETARALNPNATEIMGDLGLRYALLADWGKAVPLLKEAYWRNPALPGTYRMGLWLDHFCHDRHDEALSEARKIHAPNVIWGFLVEAASLASLGRKYEAAVAISHVLEIDPDYACRVADDLASGNCEAGLARKIIQALGTAGLTTAEHAGPRRA